MTREPAPIGLSARGGGNNEKEIYVSVDISGSFNQKAGQYNKSLSPDEKKKIIIRILFTIEHELGHDEQRKDLKSASLSPDIIKLAKSMAFIDFWDEASILRCAYPIVNGIEVDPKYMYQNVHEYLFIEQDANRRAYEAVARFLKTNGMDWLVEDLENYYNSKKVSNNNVFEASFLDYDSNTKSVFRGNVDELVEYTLDYYAGFADITDKYPILKCVLGKSSEIESVNKSL